MGSSVTPSAAAAARAFFLDGKNELLAQRRELCRESRDGGCQLRNGRVVICCGCCQVCDEIHRVLVEVPVVRVCDGIVRRSVGDFHIVFNLEAPLPVGGGEDYFEMGGSFVTRLLLVPPPIISREHINLKCIYYSETRACTIIECTIVHNVRHVTSTWKLIF